MDSEKKPSEPMTFEKLTKIAIEWAEYAYDHNSDPEYDPIPTAFLAQPDGGIVIAALAGGPPHQMLPFVLEKSGAVMYAFACATWWRTADPKTGEPNSERYEGFLVTVEDGEQCITHIARVERTPLPVLGSFKKMDGCEGRMTNLLSRNRPAPDKGNEKWLSLSKSPAASSCWR